MFFAPPQTVETTVFARLPDELRAKEPDLEWVNGQTAGIPWETVLEGPSFDTDGNLICVDIPNGRILQFAPNGHVSVLAQYDGWPNGLKIHRDGRIFIADFKHGIMVLDRDTGRVEPFLVRVNMERFKAVNDLFFAQNGDLYFTDQGLTGWQDPSGRLFRVKPDASVQCLMDNLPSPNGLVMNLDESAILLAVTRANAIWRAPLLRDGTVAKVGTFVQLSGGTGPDGIALDAEGRLAIAHVGMGCVWVVDERGEPVYRVNSCKAPHTTNLAFGGPDGRSLFITESRSATILRAELDVPGKPMFSHQGAED
ncbi:MAG: gluconolactonase [Enterovirga sp.]|nr:gluconolactonase [Enterovirga sp.]